MKIIIVGAGRIGRNLSQSLVAENHEVYLIERKDAVAMRANEKLDVKVVFGSGSDPEVLKSVDVQNADLVVAVTTSDETNLVVCILASIFGAKRRIARVRNTSLSSVLDKYGYCNFNIDEIINPELLAAQHVVKAINTPGASEVADFAGGKVLLRAFDVENGSLLCNMPIADLRVEDFPWPFLIVALVRDKEVMIPKGDTVIQKDDRIYVLLPAHSLVEFLSFVNPNIRMPKKVVIYGATITGEYVANAIAKHVKDIIVIEENPIKASEMANRLKHATIINGSAAEADILTESGIEAADVFLATSENDHSNLVSSVLAKKMGAKSTAITTQQPDYMTIIDELDIDVIINPHYLAVDQLMHLIRGKGITAVTKILEGQAEALELVPEEGSAITKSQIKDIRIPREAIIGAISRGEETLLVKGDTQLQPGDKTVVFALPSAINKIQKMFSR